MDARKEKLRTRASSFPLKPRRPGSRLSRALLRRTPVGKFGNNGGEDCSRRKGRRILWMLDFGSPRGRSCSRHRVLRSMCINLCLGKSGPYEFHCKCFIREDTPCKPGIIKTTHFFKQQHARLFSGRVGNVARSMLETQTRQPREYSRGKQAQMLAFAILHRNRYIRIPCEPRDFPSSKMSP